MLSKACRHFAKISKRGTSNADGTRVHVQKQRLIFEARDDAARSTSHVFLFFMVFRQLSLAVLFPCATVTSLGYVQLCMPAHKFYGPFLRFEEGVLVGGWRMVASATAQDSVDAPRIIRGRVCQRLLPLASAPCLGKA